MSLPTCECSSVRAQITKLQIDHDIMVGLLRRLAKNTTEWEASTRAQEVLRMVGETEGTEET